MFVEVIIGRCNIKVFYAGLCHGLLLLQMKENTRKFNPTMIATNTKQPLNTDKIGQRTQQNREFLYQN